jgi:hypothetical protein
MLLISGCTDCNDIVGRHSCGCFIKESPGQRRTDCVVLLWWDPCETHESEAMTLFEKYNVRIPDSEVRTLLNQ